MSTEMLRNQKSQTKDFIEILSREKYIQILEVVGGSRKPLSTREIEKTWYTDYYIRDSASRDKNKKEKSHAYIYNMIQKLAGFESKAHIRLISCNEFLSKVNEEKYKFQAVNTINKIFGIPIMIQGRNKKGADFDVEFRVDCKEEDRKGSLFFLVKKKNSYLHSKDFKNSILEVIGLDFDKGGVDLTIKENPEGRQLLRIPIIVKNKNRRGKNHKNDDFSFYIKSSDILRKNVNITPFLKYTLKESAKEKISELREKMKKYPLYVSGTNQVVGHMFEDKSDQKHYFEIQKIKNNPRNFRYYLSLRGFLCYLLPIKSKDKISDEKDKPNPISIVKPNTNRKINNIIKSLSENQYTKSDYPFLQKYDIFDIIYGSHYKVEVLKETAFELQNQLEKQSDKFLIYWITKRYHEAMVSPPFLIARPVFRSSNIPILQEVLKKRGEKKGIKLPDMRELFNEIKEYHGNMIRFLLEYQEEETDLTRKLLEAIEHNPLYQY